MGVIAGIDEAGYGPLLGPLVVSMTAFRTPADVRAGEGPCLWEALGADTVARERPSGRAGARSDRRLVVCDSKVLYQGGKGLARMEEAVLAFRAAASGGGASAGGGGAASVGEAARAGGTRGGAGAADAGGAMCTSGAGGAAVSGAASRAAAGEPWAGLIPEDRAVLSRYPWYEGFTATLPRFGFRSVIEEALARLRAALARAGVEALAVVPEVAHPAELNGGVREAGNKHLFEWQVVGRFLRALHERWGEEGVLVTVDRLSGRTHYGGPLARLFPGSRVVAAPAPGADEARGAAAAPPAPAPDAGAPPEPAYEVRGPGRRLLRVRFVAGGDGKRFETALASMTSKLLRELFMEPLNAFFAARVPGLKPTAGYVQDGRRFLAEVSGALAEMRVDRSLLVRVA